MLLRIHSVIFGSVNRLLRRFKVREFPLQSAQNFKNKRPTTLKGPLRVLKLCFLGILLPALLIAVPLYMRYHVYGQQLYPLAMSDMRLIDNKISSTWCQRQLVRVNTTFNAFLLENAPTLSSSVRPITMVRHLILEDDMKEYWGFYLLAGSSVTVSTCVRWPGASLIVIRGHKHLQECAYIGDNSSEELDELMEAIREGTYVAPQTQGGNKSDDAQTNEPNFMKRHRTGVEFHDPNHSTNSTGNNKTVINKAIDTSDITDSVAMKKILEALQATKHGKSSASILPNRNSTIGKGESGNFKIVGPPNTNSQELFEDILARLEDLGEKGGSILKRINQKFNASALNANPKSNVMVNEQKIDMKGRHYSKPVIQFEDNIDKTRKRRDITIASALDRELNEDDEGANVAAEEGFVPDGIADHRGSINETTPNDYSNSEFWSSFSSSEEALLNCAGLILNLPLTPHHKCSPSLSEQQAEETYLANTITYKVPVNGYYFFVFNSENEVQPNYIRVQFHLKKTVYNVSDSVSSCVNSSEVCAVKLNFFASQKLVMELPVRENDTFWNEEFVVISECEPRTVIYAICVIAVPVLVVLFAFS